MGLLLLTLCLPSYSADVVVIRTSGEVLPEQRQLEIAAQFYGLDCKVVTVRSDDVRPLLVTIRQRETLAVALQADILPRVSSAAFLQALSRKPGPSVPLLIFGVTGNTGSAMLSQWSAGAVSGTTPVSSQGELPYSITKVKGVTDELTGLAGVFRQTEALAFQTSKTDSPATDIMTVGTGTQKAPIFVASKVNQERMFFLGTLRSAEGSQADWMERFATIAPAMMFVKYSAGDRGWHTVQHYANLTIDDPWLREPYGHLNYRDLLHEMETHNFHTTIAFIPWNYARSEGDVVSLFRRHPDRFSVCIHGDNHDHKEFEDLVSKSFKVQIAALQQSLARMQQFKALTGIPYDMVFVFPHSIGPEVILTKLKEYNFLATVNSGNVPMDRHRPSESEFILRPVTVAFADFPSIVRYPAGVPVSSGFLRISAFLGNPLLFYGHQDLFTNGIDAFDHIADEVNDIEPDMRWRSLGDVVRHLYLIRASGERRFEILAFGRAISLTNSSTQEEMFWVRKRESSVASIASVTVDGQAQPITVSGGYLQAQVVVPARSTRTFEIRYRNDLNLAFIPTANSSLRIYLLRKLSDFRDIALSKYTIGSSFTRFYYEHEMTPSEAVGGSIALLAILGCVGMVLVARVRANHSRQSASSGAWKKRTAERQ